MAGATRIGLAVGPEFMGIYADLAADGPRWRRRLEALGVLVETIDLGTTNGLEALWRCHGLVMLSDGAYSEAGGALTLSVLAEWCRRGGVLACVGVSPFLLAVRDGGIESQARVAMDIFQFAIGFNGTEVELRRPPHERDPFGGAHLPDSLVELNQGAASALILHAIPNPVEVALEAETGEAVLASYALEDGWLVNWAAAVQPDYADAIAEGVVTLLLDRVPSVLPERPQVVIDQYAQASTPSRDVVMALVAGSAESQLEIADVEARGRVLGQTRIAGGVARFDVDALRTPRFLAVGEAGQSSNHGQVILPARRPLPVSAAVNPEPTDFDAFWTQQLAKLDHVPKRFQLELSAELSSDAFEVHRVQFLSADFMMITGILSRPRRPKATATTQKLLSLPGYAVGGLEAHPWWLADEHTILSIDVRRVGSPLGGPASSAEGILTHRLDSTDRPAMRGALLDCVRAFDILREIEPGSAPAVMGTSQGGGLAMGVGAFRPDAAALVSCVPFLLDIARVFETVTSEPYAELQRLIAKSPERRAELLRTLSYVDAAFFLPRTTSRCLIVASEDDDISPLGALPLLAAPHANVELRLRPGGHLSAAHHLVRAEIADWLSA